MKQWKHKCELQLLVCEPNPLRPDRVTVGFVLRDLNPEDPRVEVRFAKSLRAVQCIYPEADLEAIEGTLDDMRSVLVNVMDFEKFMQHLPSDFPGEFALLPGRAVLTDSIEEELVVLDTQYLRPGPRKVRLGDQEQGVTGINGSGSDEHHETGRAYLHRKMQESFIRAGIWNYLIKGLPIEEYTFKGDPLTIDFAYRTKNGSLRMFHAVSLVTALDKTKNLGLSWPFVREGIAKKDQGDPQLLAVTERDHFTQHEIARNARQWLIDVGLKVQPVSKMMGLAEQVRRDLEL